VPSGKPPQFTFDPPQRLEFQRAGAHLHLVEATAAYAADCPVLKARAGRSNTPFHPSYECGICQQLLLVLKPGNNALPLDDNGIVADFRLRNEREGLEDWARRVGPLLVECGYSQEPTYSHQKKGRARKDTIPGVG